MTNELLELGADSQQGWYAIIQDQLVKTGFDMNLSMPFYECSVPGENSKPNIPKPPLLMPVIKPTAERLAEHGQYGRYDHRSSPEWRAAIEEHDIQSLEQEEGLDPDSGVFLFEFFNFESHVGVQSGGLIADQIIEHRFQITNAFTGAVSNDPVRIKLTEIANMIKNAAERTGLDVAQIDSKQWAAIFRHSNSMLLGTINLPDYQIQVAAGAQQAHIACRAFMRQGMDGDIKLADVMDYRYEYSLDNDQFYIYSSLKGQNAYGVWLKKQYKCTTEWDTTKQDWRFVDMKFLD